MRGPLLISDVTVTGDDMHLNTSPVLPGTTYWYKAVTVSAKGQEVDDAGGQCYSVVVPPA